MDQPIDLLAASAAALAAGDDLDTTVGLLLGAFDPALGVEFAAVTLSDADEAGLQVAVTVGSDERARAAVESAAMAGAGPMADTATDRTPRIADGILHLPLVVSRGGIDQVVGILSIPWARESDPAGDERTLLGAMCSLIAVAIDRARMSSLVAERAEWFERVSQSDPLTGLANARTFRRVLELELARASRHGGDVSLAIFDVDAFAETNEVAGHAVGDDVLRSVAAVLAESVRLVDTVARLGGDEFVLVAPGSAGVNVARRVLDGIAALPERGGRRTSISAGVARFPADAGSADELLSAARAALDRAKAEGTAGLQDASAAPKDA